eukprot:scaffold232_cov91-Cylindrotheca_fusiformis.AAC.4
MEEIRHTLFAPAASSFLLIMGVLSAVQENVKHRYLAKDDNGKLLLSHPYSPWEVPADSKYKKLTDRAWRAFKMTENIKEFTFASLPLVWTFGIFGGCLPYVSNTAVTAILLSSTSVYAYGNYKYMHGYVEAPEKRLEGFGLRIKVFQLWVLLTVGSLLAYLVQESGVFKS